MVRQLPRYGGQAGGSSIHNSGRMSDSNMGARGGQKPWSVAEHLAFVDIEHMHGMLSSEFVERARGPCQRDRPTPVPR